MDSFPGLAFSGLVLLGVPILRLRSGRRRRDGSPRDDTPAPSTDEFGRAAAWVRAQSLDALRGHELKLYGLYKAATVGPCSGPPPSRLDTVARAKHDAWKELGALNGADARAAYVRIVASLHGPAAGGADDELGRSESEMEEEEEEEVASSRRGGSSGFSATSRPLADGALVLSAAELSRDIHHQCQLGDLAAVTALLDAEASLVNARNDAGETPLHVAADAGHERVVEALLARGADAAATEDGGQTALEYAEALGHDAVVQLLRAVEAVSRQ
jgi:acyl-CoA-binding protein